MDDMDRAQARDQAFLADAHAAHYRNRVAAVSATHCEDCDRPIPEQRRTAAPGCTRCVNCQTSFENHPRWRTA